MRTHLTHPKYRPDIDGLRAVAVLSVVGFHAFPNWVKGGFVGVDVFFVISGFLISGIIFASLESKNFSYAEFYSRRIKRIFPALLLVLAFTQAVGWYVLLTNEYSQLGKHVASGVGFFSNFSLWQEAGYFDSGPDTKPLLHLWSLGIEEQFYIFWPLLLGFVWRRKFNFLTITLLVALASFAVNIYTVRSQPVAVFYSPLSRFWEVMIGGMLAYLALHKPHYLVRQPNWQSACGLLLLAAGFALLDQESRFPGWWALLPTLGTFLVISAGPQAWLNRHVFGNKILVWVGLISFPLYLWHWPLLSFVRIVEGGALDKEIRVGVVALSITLAWLTYTFLEKSVRNRPGKKPIIVLMSAALLLFAGGMSIWGNLIKPRNSGADIEAIFQAGVDWSYPPKDFQSYQVKGQVFYKKRGAAQEVLFLGDSHIEQYYPRISWLLSENPGANKSVILATMAGCPPIPSVFEDKHPGCGGFLDTAIKYLQSYEIQSVVIGACWSCYFIEEAKPGPDAIYDFYYLENTDKRHFRNGPGVDLALASLEKLLTTLVRQKTVFLLLDNPMGEGFDPRNYLAGSRLTTLSRREPPTQFVQLDRDQALLRERLIALAKRANVRVIDPVARFCKADQCPTLMEDGTPIYMDTNHIRPYYSARYADFIDVAIEQPSAAQ